MPVDLAARTKRPCIRSLAGGPNYALVTSMSVKSKTIADEMKLNKNILIIFWNGTPREPQSIGKGKISFELGTGESRALTHSELLQCTYEPNQVEFDFVV